MNIEDLKIGARLFMGRYSADDENTFPNYISWIKVSKDAFMSEFVIDCIQLDARMTLSRDAYERSDLNRFLGNDGDLWFNENEAGRGDTRPFNRRHCGFMRYFQDYEKDAANNHFALPEAKDIVALDSDERLEFFVKKGRRAKASPDLIKKYEGKYFYNGNESKIGISPTEYISYWVKDIDYYVEAGICLGNIINKSGKVEQEAISAVYGLRPMFRFKKGVEVIPHWQGAGYEIKPYEVFFDDEFSDEDFMNFLGI